MTTEPGATAPRDPRAGPVVVAWLRAWASSVHDQRTWLTDLDAAIGDGDHGINLDRGLVAVAADLDGGMLPQDDAGAVLAAGGRRLMGVVGGASGALYGRALVRAGAAVTKDPDFGRLPLVALDAAVGSIVDLGHAVPGDKTMLDALIPALDVLRAASPGEPAGTTLQRAAAAADTGAQGTIPLVARKGRASYLGERSAGHLDPGAASSAMLVRCLAQAFAEAIDRA